MNRTLLLALLSRCGKVIQEELDNIGDHNISTTTTTSPASTANPTSAAADTRKSYDNAYFYVLFVMFFYCFLSLALFKNFFRGNRAKKDLDDEEFRAGGLKLNTGPEAVERFDFEDECIL